MPHAEESEFQLISCKQLGETFTAEISGVDFSKPIPQEVYEECRRALSKYGAITFRKANVDDDAQVNFAGMFGDLDNVKPWMGGKTYRLKHLELFDVSNLEEDGSLVQIGSMRHHVHLVNSFFHCDLSYNPRRAGVSLLRAAVLPPPGNGGPTEFADTRTAWDELPADLKKELLENEYVGCNNLLHSRKKTAPADSPWMKDLNPEDADFGRHMIVQDHWRSGRTNMYISIHLHHLEYLHPKSPDFVPTPEQPYERVPEPYSTQLIERLLAHASQPRYVSTIHWENENDLLIWDNTCVMHRSGKGTFMGKHFRDMRRATVHDDSPTAWGLNDTNRPQQGIKMT